MEHADDDPSAEDTAGAEIPDTATGATSPIPVLVAFVLTLVLGTLAFFYLRDDTPGDVVRPDTFAAVGEAEVAVTAFGPFSPDAEVVAVGYALGEDTVYLEMVIDGGRCDGDEPCGGPEALTATIVLPETIEGRSLEWGTGRALAECEPDGDDARCPT